VRICCRTVLVAIVVVSLADIPMANAAARALGFVLQAESSQIDGIVATNGSNVFAGDALSTNPNGRIHLQFGTDQIYIPASTQVKLANGKEGVTAVLSAGTLEFAAPQGTGFSVIADDVLVKPKTPQLTHAQVTLLSKDELRIATVTGPLDLEMDGESYTLAPGRTYGIRIVNSRDEEQYQPHSARRRRGLIIFLFAATAAVAGVIYTVQEMQESPDFP
jgi:hypothetical protein